MIGFIKPFYNMGPTTNHVSSRLVSASKWSNIKIMCTHVFKHTLPLYQFPLENSEYDQKPQTTLWHREEEPLNHHETPGRQIKQSNQLSLPHQDDCNTRTDTNQRTTKHRTITDSHNGSNNKQKVNNNRTTALERTAA